MVGSFRIRYRLPHRNVLVLIFTGCLMSFTFAHNFEFDYYPPQDVITRDVCIIGGGSSGVYAAVGLHDMGKSVVVVEKKDRLGGHTETYIDPATQIPVDIGVQDWHNISAVTNYFTRLNVSFILDNVTADFSVPTLYADFSSGKPVNYTLPDPTAALAAYAAELAKYPYLSLGFDLPSPVPEDLLLPFGEFVTKYALEAAVFTIYLYAQGIGDLLSQPTIYVMKLIGLDTLQSIQSGFLATASHDNSEVYAKAGNVLGEDNVLLNTEVVTTDRKPNDGGYVKIVVRTSDGHTKLILAKKLVIAILPKLDNLVGFDLTPHERALFKQFGNQAYYTGLLRHSGLPATFVTNVNANTPYNLPVLPAVYGFNPTSAPGLISVFYGSTYSLSGVQVKSDIVASLERLREVDTVNTTTPSFAAFSSHVPFELTVPTKAIAGGFYRDLYGLQGCSQTYYTGAAFHTQDSSLLWRFTEALLPEIVA